MLQYWWLLHIGHLNLHLLIVMYQLLEVGIGHQQSGLLYRAYGDIGRGTVECIVRREPVRDSADRLKMS